MSLKGIIMFLGMNNIRVERKILIILDFENRFLPTYLPQWSASLISTPYAREYGAANEPFGHIRIICTDHVLFKSGFDIK